MSLADRLLFAAAVAASAALVGPAGAQTFEGEGATAVLEGIGIIPPDNPEITIKERGPLVLPAVRDLPPPKAPGAVASAAPEWPNDPDEQVAKNKRTEDLFNEQFYSGRLLTPKEMQADKLAPGTVVKKDRKQTRESEHAAPILLPSELAGGHKLLGKDDSWAEKGEPQRSSMTDPPTGYRTPSTAAPYAAAPPRKNDFWSKLNPFK